MSGQGLKKRKRPNPVQCLESRPRKCSARRTGASVLSQTAFTDSFAPRRFTFGTVLPFAYSLKATPCRPFNIFGCCSFGDEARAIAAAQRSQLQTPRQAAQSDWEAIVNLNDSTQTSVPRGCRTPKPQAEPMQPKAQQAPRMEHTAEARAGAGAEETSNHAFVAHGLMDIFASQVVCRKWMWRTIACARACAPRQQNTALPEQSG